ncbi:MAG: starch-binding protein [Muribaculaceae bacterium]|nr:starch-binding protein [Muribaculaceae bacterium]
MKKLLLTLVACVTALAANAWTVYFTNPAGWTEVSVYTFNSETLGTWPGKGMTKNNSTGLWEYTSGTGSPKNIIFNNNNKGEQTDNLDFQQGAIYTFVGPMPSELYMIGKVGSIDWNPTEGVKMKSEGNGVFTLEGIEINGGFAFTSKLGTAGDWNSAYNKYRYGPKKINGNDAPAVIGTNSINWGGDFAWSFSTPGTYDVKVDLMKSVLTISVPVTPPDYPDNFYYIGNLGSSSWDLPGKPFENEGGGIYTLEDVNIGQNSTTNGYFALTTSDSSDWGLVNSNRYGPSASTEITLTGDEAEVSFVRNNNGDISWNITPGTYTLTISYDDNQLTIEKTGEFVEPEPETPVYYLLGEMNEWGSSADIDKYKFVEDNGVYTLSLPSIDAGVDFKISDLKWSKPYSTGNKNMTVGVYENVSTSKDTGDMAFGENINNVTFTLDTNTDKLTITGTVEEEVTLYLVGNNIDGERRWGGTDSAEGVQMTYLGGGLYEWSGDLLGSGFKIYDGDWDSDLDYGTEQDSGTTLILGEAYSVIAADGCDNIDFEKLSWILNPTVIFNKTASTVTVTGVKPLFLMGSEIIGAAEGSKPWTANDSYYFQKTGEGVYTLTVGSISSDCEFKIGTEDWTIAYSSKEMDMKANYATGYDLVTDQSAGNMGLVSSLLNATFTITLEATEEQPINSAWGPYTSTANLVITGTEDNSTSWVLTLGNDKTMQDGTITDNNISITTANPNKGALVYVYAPAEAVAVYFKVTPTSQSAKRMAAPDLTGYTKAAVNPYDSEAYSLPLAEGSGSVSLYYEKADGDFSAEKTYTYTVKTGVTTGVEGIGADEEDAVYYNLQGVKVDNPEKGIFVKVVNGTASKVVL